MRRWRATLCIVWSAVACSDPARPAVEPTALQFVSELSDLIAGTPFDVVVDLVGANGARATGDDTPVTLALAGGVIVSGPTVVSTSRGRARFRDLVITQAAGDLEFTATAGAFAPVVRNFAVRAARPSLVRSTILPSANSVPANEPVVFSVTFRDEFDNPVRDVSVSLTTSLGGTTFTPASGTTDQDGAFAATFRATVPGAAPITALVDGAAVGLRPGFAVCSSAPMAIPGTLNGAVQASQCVSGGVPNAIYTFSTASSGGAAFTVTSPFPAVLNVKTEPPQESIGVVATQGAPLEWLLPAGSFQVRVGAQSGAGAFSLSSAITPGNGGCVTRFITAAGTFIGQQLAAGDCPFGDGTLTDIYGVFSSRPCSIRLQSAEFTPWLWLYEQNMFQINGTTGFDPGSDAVFGLPACKYQNGPIYIWVNSEVGESGGNYTLIVTFTGSASVSAPAAPVISAASVARPPATASSIAALRNALRAKAAKR